MPTTPEEKAVIKAALRWQQHPISAAEDLRLAVQALRISRRPLEGPEPIPCMARARHSATMFCILPKGHAHPWDRSSGPMVHYGHAANGSRRSFYAVEPL